MDTLLIAVGSFVGFIVAYHTYGRWLGRKIFGLDEKAPVPSSQLRDDVDFVPTKKQVIFGHHFTSIAGTGPIVGPAIAVFWGWLPALLWVVFGSIFIGAVHDFGALIVSIRNRGQTVGEVAGRVIAPRTRVLFLTILFFALTVVLAIFGLVIATIFNMYPESVLSVWIAMPVAVGVGFWVYRRGGGLLVPSLLALAILYGAVVVGANWLPVTLNPISMAGITLSPILIWTGLLFAYCFFASVLPVWVLLQPRDYINSHQLVVALVLLVLGLIVAGSTGGASITESAPAVAQDQPADAPPIMPFLFITIACGAISGFHCLVSSGTSSKQVACEPDARYVGYGAMLLEGALAVLVILACCAGVGMGKFKKNLSGVYEAQTVTAEGEYAVATAASPAAHGREVWNARYSSKQRFKDFGLPQMVGAFVEGGANFLTALGIPLRLGIAVIAVLVACFAATTLDTATRLQRYVVQELATTVRVKPLTNKYAATGFALLLAGVIALIPGPKGPGTGGMILWPLFGAINQLLAGLAFMVTAFYLWRRNKPVWFILIPMTVMLIMPSWALAWQMQGWLNAEEPNYLLFGIATAILALEAWMIAEGFSAWRKAKGVLEEALPPLEPAGAAVGSQS
ncbi:MAG: carbon starvation protein A [Pirellulales bacterium]|nr:carbon starvation protein A [Pirellulales bacterium]